MLTAAVLLALVLGGGWALDIALLRDFALNAAVYANARCIVVVEPCQVGVETPDRDVSRRLGAMMAKNRSLTVGVASFCSLGAFRPCPIPLFIVLATERTQADLEEFSKGYRYSNSIWMVAMQAPVSADYVTGIRVAVDSSLFLVTPASRSAYNIWEVFSVANQRVKKVLFFGNWSSESGLVAFGSSRTSQRSDWEGAVLRTVSSKDTEESIFVNNEFLGGLSGRVWPELECILNFTSTRVKCLGCGLGLQLPSGEWTGLLGLAARREVDVVLTDLIMTPNRQKVVEFGQPLASTRYQVYSKFQGFHEDWFWLLRPFSPQVWGALFGWICGASVVIYAIDVVSRWFLLTPNFGRSHPNPLLAFFFVIQTFCSQGSSIVPAGAALRCFFVLCYLTAAVILPSYSGALISALTRKTPVKPFDDLAGLLHQRMPLLVWSNTAEIEYFSASDEPLFRSVYDLVNPKPEMQALRGYAEMYQYMCDSRDKVAVFGGEVGIEREVWRLVGSGYGCSAVKLSHGLSPVHLTLGFARNSPYKNLINYNLQRMRQNGLLRREKMRYPPENNAVFRTSKLEVNLSDVAPIFAGLLCGTLLSLLILLLELLQHSARPRPGHYA